MLENIHKRFLSLSLLSALLLGQLSIYSEEKTNALPLQEIQELVQVLELIKRNHVTAKTDRELLLAAINGMLSSVDNQSRYLTAEELKIFTQVATGTQQGQATTHGELLAKDVAYIDIDYFHAATADKVKSLWLELASSAKTGLIIDLRDNPGGFVDSAVAVSDLFLSEGLITTSRGRVAEAGQNYSATKTQIVSNIPIIILVNKQTASAAEIVAAAMQDHNKAIIAGTKTFGKGSIQSLMNTKYGAIQLTTSYYYSPKGRMIHENGLEPDILLDDQQDFPVVAESNEIKYHRESERDADWQLHWAIMALKQNKLSKTN